MNVNYSTLPYGKEVGTTVCVTSMSPLFGVNWEKTKLKDTIKHTESHTVLLAEVMKQQIK
jgi:hypothetical protein